MLPLTCREDDYVAFDVTRLIDALDLDHSDFVRDPSDGRIPDGDLYVTDRFVQQVQEAHLTGFEFTLEWPEPDA